MIAPPLTDQDIPRYWQQLGIPGLADIHTHFLPPSMLAKVWAYFDKAQDHYGRPWPIHYRFDQAERLDILRGFGLRAIPALSYPHKPGMAQWLNEWSRDLAKTETDVLHCATLYPEEGVGEYVLAELDAGAQLFKMHVQVGVFTPADPLLDPAWAVLQESGVPVVIHAGSAPISGEFTGPAGVRAVLSQYPSLALVIAHLGMNEYDAFADIAEDFINVHLDTTMVGTDFTNAFAPMSDSYVARLAGLKDKVILGTDFPQIPYPYAHQIEALQRLGHGDDWMRSVLWRNGARLLHLDS